MPPKEWTISWLDAAEILRWSPRTLRRWRWRYEQLGYDGLYDRRKKQPSPKRVPMKTAQHVLRLYREQYRDFNVRHFHEKLLEEHGMVPANEGTYTVVVANAAGSTNVTWNIRMALMARQIISCTFITLRLSSGQYGFMHPLLDPSRPFCPNGHSTCSQSGHFICLQQFTTRGLTAGWRKFSLRAGWWS